MDDCRPSTEPTRGETKAISLIRKINNQKGKKKWRDAKQTACLTRVNWKKMHQIIYHLKAKSNIPPENPENREQCYR